VLGGSGSAEAWIEHFAGLAKAAHAAPAPVARQEIFPWRSGPKPQPAPQGNHLTEQYLAIVGHFERPSTCAFCGGTIAAGEASRSDGFTSWHYPRCVPS
jgi:hypothetical protein